MTLLFLLLLTLVCYPDNWQSLTWQGPVDNPLLFAGFTWAGVVGTFLAAAWMAQRVVDQLRLHPELSQTILLRFRTWRFRFLLALMGFYGLALIGFGWGWIVQSLGSIGEDGLPEMLPGAELLVLAPFLVALVLSWICFYDAERAAHNTGPGEPLHPFWSRRAHVNFQVRQHLGLIMVPVLLLILLKGAQRLVDPGPYPWIFPMIATGIMATAFIGLPWLLRWVLGLEPLPPSPLRDRLQEAARRLNFRCSNILLWNTNGGVANAMVAGLVPRVRYIVLTDRLVEDLTPDEVEAVFGHEVGHVKHYHLIYYLGFLLISLTLVTGFWNLAAPILAPHLPWIGPWFLSNEDVAALPLYGLLGAYVFVVFGFLSRRCERQADIFGCRAVSCARPDCACHQDSAVLLPGGKGLCPTGIRTFIGALEKVARVNGIHRNRPGWLQSWQHSTIARRVDFLQCVLADPTLEARFQQTVGLVKMALLLCLGAALLLLTSLGGWQSLRLF